MRKTRAVRRTLVVGVGLGLGLAAAARAAETPQAAGVDPKQAFELLKGLAGTWNGNIETATGPAATVQFVLASGGTVVEEVQFPGTPHEMRSLYHMDGPDLVMTHYCAMGNQPHMRLDKGRSSTKELIFDFAGGTNMDPAKDMHIHSGWIRLVGPDRVEAEWMAYAGTQPQGGKRFFLTRAR
jgi:hypothetical protein